MKIISEIATRLNGRVSEFLCPRCGHAHLQQGPVTVFSRQKDAEAVTVVTAYDGELIVTSNSSNAMNPSPQTDGFMIQFACEACGDEPLFLRIAQHKGFTGVCWAVKG